MVSAINGGIPQPGGFEDWKTWAEALVHTLELQGEDVVQSIVSFNTTDQTLDAAGRLRVSQSVPILETYFESNSEDRIWDTVLAGTGTFSYNTVPRNISLSTGGTGSGARSMRQLKTYLRFRRGKSTVVNINYTPHSAGTFSGAAKSRAGYFDDTDGIYFQVSAAGPAVVFRGSGTGATLETVVPQASWNLDKLTGNGASREKLDVTLPQALIIDFSTLNIGRIRFGFRFDGQIVYFHESVSFNGVSPAAFVRRSLPVRLEVINDAGVGSNVSLRHGGMAVWEEGGLDEEDGYLSSATTAGTFKAVADSATLTPVLAIRLKDTFGGLDVHGLVKLLKVNLFNSSNNPVYYEILEDGISLTGASFTSIGSESIVEQDVSSSSFTGGNRIASGFINASSGSGTISVVDLLDSNVKPRLGRLYTGVRPPILLACRGISGTANVGASFSLKEYF